MSELDALLASLSSSSQKKSPPPEVNKTEENSQLNSLLNSLSQPQANHGSFDLQSSLSGINTTVNPVQPKQETNTESNKKSNEDFQAALDGLLNVNQQSQPQPPQSPLSGLLNQQPSQPQQQQSALSGLLGQPSAQPPQQQSALAGLLGSTPTAQPPQQQSALAGLLGQPSQQPPQPQSALAGLLGSTPTAPPPQQDNLSSLLSGMSNLQPAQNNSPLSSLLGGSHASSNAGAPSSLSSLVSKPTSASASAPTTNLAKELKPLDLKEKPIQPYKRRTAQFTAKKTVTFNNSGSLSDFVSNAEPFTVIELPTGTYELGCNLKLPLHIKSASGAKVTIKNRTDSEIISSSSPFLILEGLNFVQESQIFGDIVIFEGFVKMLNCDVKTAKFTPMSIQGNSASGSIVEIENCQFHAVKNTCIVAQSNSTVYLKDTRVENSEEHGIWVQKGAKCYVDKGCVITNNGGAGITAQKNCTLLVDGGANKEIEVSKNKDSGIEVVDNSTAYIENVVIRENLRTSAVLSSQNSFVTVKNSKITDNQCGGIRSETDSSLLSINNELTNSVNNQMVIAHVGGVIQCENDRISGSCASAVVAIEKGYVQLNNCKLDKITGPGVVSYDQASVRITNSSLTDINLVAIQVRDGTKLYMENTTITNSDESGISLTRDAMAYLKNVKISKMREIGIQISSITQGFIDIINCESFENIKGGILIQDNVIEGCCNIQDSKFYKNSKLGANANGNSTKPKFVNCSFTENSVVGFHILNGAEVTLINSVFRGEGMNGIFLNKATAHIEKADFSEFTHSAVTCSNSANVTVKDSKIHDNYNFAVYASDDNSHAKFVNCQFTNHNRSGTIHSANRSVVRCVDCKIDADLEPHATIYDGGKVSMKNCDLSNSLKGIGIYVREDGIFKCNKTTIHDEVGKAIEIGKKGVVIATDSTFRNNGNCGIMVRQYGSATFTNCLFDSNAQTGISMQGGNLTLNNCTISNHEIQGICLTKSSNLVDNNTKFSKNGQNNIIYIE